MTDMVFQPGTGIRSLFRGKHEVVIHESGQLALTV